MPDRFLSWRQILAVRVAISLQICGLIPPLQHQLQQPAGSGAIFFSGRRSTPGTTPAASQLDWLISKRILYVAPPVKGMNELADGGRNGGYN